MGYWSCEYRNEPKHPASTTQSQSGASSVFTARSGFLVVSSPGEVQIGQSSFWLREYVAERVKTCKRPISEAYRSEPVFCGITTSPERGIVDTAAEGGLIGKPALEKLIY